MRLILFLYKAVVAATLFLASADWIQLFEEAASSSSESIENLKVLLTNPDVDVNAITENGESLLHLACIRGIKEKIQLLLAYGADPNFRATKHSSSLHMTPLTWCTYGGYTDAIGAFLADERTKVNMVVLREDGRYITALDIAHSIGELGNEAVALLEAAGAKSFVQLHQEHGSDVPDTPLDPSL